MVKKTKEASSFFCGARRDGYRPDDRIQNQDFFSIEIDKTEKNRRNGKTHVRVRCRRHETSRERLPRRSLYSTVTRREGSLLLVASALAVHTVVYRLPLVGREGKRRLGVLGLFIPKQ